MLELTMEMSFPVYLLIGAVFAYIADQMEMKKDVPFGTFPAIAPLVTIRRVCFCFFTLFGGFILVTVAFALAGMYAKFRVECAIDCYKMWKVKRRLIRMIRTETGLRIVKAHLSSPDEFIKFLDALQKKEKNNGNAGDRDSEIARIEDQSQDGIRQDHTDGIGQQYRSDRHPESADRSQE